MMTVPRALYLMALRSTFSNARRNRSTFAAQDAVDFRLHADGALLGRCLELCIVDDIGDQLVHVELLAQAVVDTRLQARQREHLADEAVDAHAFALDPLHQHHRLIRLTMSKTHRRLYAGHGAT